MLIELYFYLNEFININIIYVAMIIGGCNASVVLVRDRKE